MDMTIFNDLKDIIEKHTYEDAVKMLVRTLLAPDIEKIFNQPRKILCVQPHPDDCDLSAGGTLIKSIKNGAEAIYLTLTDGLMGTIDPKILPEELSIIRKKEQEDAAGIIGVKKFIWLNYRDTELPYSSNIRKLLVNIIRKERPSIILAPDPWLPYEGHPDHRVAGMLSIEAAIFAGLVHYAKLPYDEDSKPHNIEYMVFYNTHRPNLYYNIDDVIEIKLKALKQHKSQFLNNWDSVELFIRTLNMLYGKMINTKYAEAFKVIPKDLLHVATVAEHV
ncbi:MAG: PIG-L deacetylase family protein [Thermoprotei archaeon]